MMNKKSQMIIQKTIPIIDESNRTITLLGDYEVRWY